MLFRNFNSIKVQLKREILPCLVQECLPFQFHKGTIKADFSSIVHYASCKFQFHKGTIKANRLRNIAYYVVISIP